MIYFFIDKQQHIPYFIDYINSINKNYNNTQLITDYKLLINILNDNCKIIFIYNIPDDIITKYKHFYNKIYYLNTEQLSREEYVKKITEYYNLGIKCIDYSKANINCLNFNKDVLYLPYLINTNEIFNYDKKNDIVFTGDFTSNYRKNIINNLQKNNINIKVLYKFNKQRDDELFTYKILLNVHFNETYKIFEQMRCNRCIFNKMIVITEKSLDIDYELKEYIIECDYDKLVETTINVLQNYNYYYDKLFKNLDLNNIHENYMKLSNKVINDISTSFDYVKPSTHININDYDHVISLGNKCPTTMILRDLNLYKESFPFDFIPTSPCLILKYLKDTSTFFPEKNKVYNNDNVWFGHFNINDKYDETILTFQRRFERLFEILENKKKILFIYSSEADIYNELGNRYNDNYNDLCKIIDYIKNTYNYNDFSLVAIHTNKNYTNTDNILNYTINVPTNYLSDDMSTHNQPTTSKYRAILKLLMTEIFTK
jgi:hypothetical protein